MWNNTLGVQDDNSTPAKCIIAALTRKGYSNMMVYATKWDGSGWSTPFTAVLDGAVHKGTYRRAYDGYITISHD